MDDVIEPLQIRSLRMIIQLPSDWTIPECYTWETRLEKMIEKRGGLVGSWGLMTEYLE